ncbi:MAG: hypothetical protein ACRC9T_06935 [Vibrionaceae bacterium]
MQPTNTTASPDLFTQTQLSDLLAGRIGDRVYGNLQNAVVALQNSPERPATQGAVAQRSEFDALLERVDLQMSLLEENDSRADGASLPTLNQISAVRSVLANHIALYQSKKELDSNIKQNAEQAVLPADDAFEERIDRLHQQYTDAANQANLELRSIRHHLSSSRLTACSQETQRSQALEATALPTAITNAIDNAAAPVDFEPSTEHDSLQRELIKALSNNEAMHVTDPSKQTHLFSHLYAMMNSELLKNVPSDLESLLDFLLPPACTETKTPLAQLQLLIAALRGLDHTTAARVNGLLNTQITNELTAEMLLSRAQSSGSQRNQFLMLANQLPENAQKRAVLLFARTIIGICQQFVTEHKRLQENAKACAEQLSLEQKHKKMLDNITVRQLNTESQMWEKIHFNPGTTPATALLLPQRTPRFARASRRAMPEPTDCLLPETNFNYIAHDHQLMGIAGEIPKNSNKREAFYRALFKQKCAAVHVVSTKNEDDEINNLFYPEDLSFNTLLDYGADVVVKSIKQLSAAQCTPFAEDLGVKRIRRNEYEVILTTGKEQHTCRVLQTFVDDNDEESFWENHGALRQAFLAASQPHGASHPLLTLSKWNSYNAEDPQDDISDFLRAEPPLGSGEPTLALQTLAADILLQDSQSSLLSTVAALRACGYSKALNNEESLALLEKIETQRNTQRPALPANTQFMADFLSKNIEILTLRQQEIESELSEKAARSARGDIADTALHTSDMLRSNKIEAHYDRYTQDGQLHYIVHNGDSYDPVGLIPQTAQDIVQLYEMMFEHRLPSLHLSSPFTLHFPANIYQLKTAQTEQEQQLIQECGLGFRDGEFLISEQGVSSAGQSRMHIFTDQADSNGYVSAKMLGAPLTGEIKMHHHTVLLVKDGRKQRLNVLVTEYSGAAPTAQMMQFFHQQREQMRESDPSCSPIITLANGLIKKPALHLIGTDILLNDPNSSATSVIAALRACTDPRELGADLENLQLVVDVETMRREQEQQRQPLQQLNTPEVLLEPPLQNEEDNLR